MNTQKPWYTEEAGFFGEAYIAEYQSKLDIKARKEVDLIEKLLGIAGCPSTVLDVPCGYGRHALELARRGHHVTGIDLNRRFLDLAVGTAQRESITLKLAQADMRSFTYTEEFDVALNFFTSIGYFDSSIDDILVFNNIVRALKRGGRFLLDTVNPAWRLANLKDLEKRTLAGGGHIVAAQAFDKHSRILSEDRMIYEPDGTMRKLPTVRTRLYTYDELISMGSYVGLKMQSSNQSMMRDTINNHMRRILLVFVKT